MDVYCNLSAGTTKHSKGLHRTTTYLPPTLCHSTLQHLPTAQTQQPDSHWLGWIGIELRSWP